MCQVDAEMPQQRERICRERGLNCVIYRGGGGEQYFLHYGLCGNWFYLSHSSRPRLRDPAYRGGGRNKSPQRNTASLGRLSGWTLKGPRLGPFHSECPASRLCCGRLWKGILEKTMRLLGLSTWFLFNNDPWVNHWTCWGLCFLSSTKNGVGPEERILQGSKMLCCYFSIPFERKHGKINWEFLWVK